MESLYRLGVIVSAVDQLTGPVRNMVGSVQELQNGMQRAQQMIDFGQRMTVAGALTEGAASRMRGVISGLISPSLAVQDALAPLSTVTNSTMESMADSMAMAREAALDWSASHRESADEFLRTSYMMASAGLNDVQSIEGTRTALRVATATMGDHSDAANLLATVYNNMGDASADVATEMTRIGDVITRTQQAFQFKDLNQLSEGLKYSMSTAIGAKMPLEDLAVVIGQLNNAGLQGSMAGTAYSATMRQMSRASQELGFEIARTADGGMDFIGTLANIKGEFGEFAEMPQELQMEFQRLFGAEGLRAISLLLPQIDAMRSSLDDVRSSAGAAADAQAAMEGTITQQYDILQNRLNLVRMTISDSLEPLIMRTIIRAQNLADGFRRFAEAHPGLVRLLAILLAVGAGALTIVAPILTIAGSFMMMMGYGMKAFLTLGKGFIKFKGLLASGKLTGILSSIGTHMKSAFNLGRSAILRAGPALTQFTGFVRSGAASLWQFGTRAAVQAALGVQRFVVGLVGMAKQAVITGATALPGLIASVWAFTAALLANPITWIIVGIVALGGAIYLLIRNWDRVSEAAGAAWQFIRDIVGAGIEFVSNAIGGLVNFLAGLFFPPLAIMFNWSSIREGMDEAGGFLPYAYGLLKEVISAPLRLVGIDPEQLLASLDNALIWVHNKFEEWREAGSALWDAFVGGLRSVIETPVEVVKGGLEKLRNLLPFSDAKEGPLSTLTQSGRAFIATLAEGMNRELPSLRKGLLAGLAGVMLTVPAPALAADMQQVVMPEPVAIAAEVQYQFAEMPIIETPEVAGMGVYEANLVSLPEIPDLTGTVQYGTVAPPPPMAPDMPVAGLPNLRFPEVQEETPAGPRFQGLGFGDLYRPLRQDLKVPALTELLEAKENTQKERGSDSSPGLVVRDGIHIHVDSLEKAEDLYDILKQIADEAGGD